MVTRTASWVALVLVLAALPAAAQDSAGVRGPRGVPPRQLLEERFAQRVKEELGLTDDQASKLRLTASRWFLERRRLEMEERTVRQALSGQLRPGVAANTDSVTRLTQRLLDLKVAYAETYREESKELGYLSPVQRAQFHVLRERLLDALDAARQNRAGRRWGT
jgi:hypothetical protein